MPNGHREPYRIRHGESPSPCHTSDSEETRDNKMCYMMRKRRMRRDRRIAMVMMAIRKGMDMRVAKLIDGFVDWRAPTGAID